MKTTTEQEYFDNHSFSKNVLFLKISYLMISWKNKTRTDKTTGINVR